METIKWKWRIRYQTYTLNSCTNSADRHRTQANARINHPPILIFIDFARSIVLIPRLIFHNTNPHKWRGYASLLRPIAPSRVNTLITVRLVPISRSLDPYSRYTEAFCSVVVFQNSPILWEDQKTAYEIPQLELLADAETWWNLHSFCVDENGRVRSSKALVRARVWSREILLIFYAISRLWQNEHREKAKNRERGARGGRRIFTL